MAYPSCEESLGEAGKAASPSRVQATGISPLPARAPGSSHRLDDAVPARSRGAWHEDQLCCLSNALLAMLSIGWVPTFARAAPAKSNSALPAAHPS